MTQNPAHATSSTLGPGSHVSVQGIDKEECEEVRAATRRRSLHRAGDTYMPGTRRVTRVRLPCAHLSSAHLLCAAPCIPPRTRLRTFRTLNPSLQCFLNDTFQDHFHISRPDDSLHSYSLSHVLHINSHFKISIILTDSVYELMGLMCWPCAF